MQSFELTFLNSSSSITSSLFLKPAILCTSQPKLDNFFAIGYAPIMIGVFMLGGVQLFFIGIVGEYILNINTRVINRPIVVEEKRINFEDEEK